MLKERAVGRASAAEAEEYHREKVRRDWLLGLWFVLTWWWPR